MRTYVGPELNRHNRHGRMDGRQASRGDTEVERQIEVVVVVVVV